MTGTYHLSYDEQQASKARMLANARLQRLLQVRAQDKQLARARSRKFKQLCADSAEHLKKELVQLITEQRAQELAELKAQYQAALDGLASAQRDAAIIAQQLALKRQQKHQQYLQREKEAQQRFVTALARVQAAQQAELQVVLDKLKRRNEIMQQQRDLAKAFAEQQKQQAVKGAQRQAEVDMLEEQRRRMNQVSKIDFRYSRLHELGVPQVVVNHKALPQENTPDAVTQAQSEAVRLQEQQQATQQRQQDNAKKAAARGVHAQLLVQAERNRQRMEQALRELESNEIEQRKQNLADGNLTAAPLLRRWQQQKRRVQARRAFENDFLPHPAAAQGSFPTFLAHEAAVEAMDQQQPEPARQAYAAEKALKLVAELERRRKMEQAAAQQQGHQQRPQQQQQQRSSAATHTARPDSSAASSEIEVPVPVGDLIDFIPAADATAPSTTDPSELESVASDADLEQLTSAADSALASTVQASASSAELEDATADTMQQLGASTVSAARSSVTSSQDSIAAIMQAADEVLQQLPAEMQAAAARRAAAAAGHKAPDSASAAGQPVAQPVPAAATQRLSVDTAAAVANRSAGKAAASAGSSESGPRSSRATDSSADAARILQELHVLQEELGLEYLASSTAGSDLEQLAAFDQEVQDLLQQQIQQHRASAAAPSIRPAPVSDPQPRPAVAAAQPASRAPLAPAAPPQQVGITQAGSIGQATAAADPALKVTSSLPPAARRTSQEPEKSDLEALIDRVLAPSYPSNLFEPLAGPQPSVDSPTRPAGKSGRRAAAAEAAAAAEPPQQWQQQQQVQDSGSSGLAQGFRELQRELMALGLPSVNLSSISSSVSGGDDAFLRNVLQSGLSSSSSEVTLPTTVAGLVGAAGYTDKAQAPPATTAMGGVPGSSTALDAEPESSTRQHAAAAAAAAAIASSLRSSSQQQQLLPPKSMTPPTISQPAAAMKGGVAAAAMAAAKQALMDLSSSMDSLSVSTDDSEIDRLLQGVPGLAQTATDAVNTVGQGGASMLSSSMTSIPSTLLRQPPAAAVNRDGFVSRQAATAQEIPASEDISLPETLQLQQERHTASINAAPAAGTREQASTVEDHLAALRELLSLRDSESLIQSGVDWQATAAAAAAAAGGPPSISSSSISSMLDDELDQLLQKALAGVSRTQQQEASIEQALEAMTQAEEATGSGLAAAAVAHSVQSVSTAIPSTVQAIMPTTAAAAARRTALSGVTATEAAAGSPSNSNSGSSSSGSASHSSHSSGSSRSEAALKMAKQSARQRAAAAAAAAVASSQAAAAGGGWSSSSTSIPSTIERHLEAVAATGSGTASTTQGSASSAASLAAPLKPYVGVPATAAATTGMQEGTERQQPQQAGREGRPLSQPPASSFFEYASSSSSSLSLPSTLWHQQQHQQQSAGSNFGFQDVPKVTANSSSSSSTVHTRNSGSSLGPNDATASIAAAPPAAQGTPAPASISTSGLKQKQQRRLPGVKQGSKSQAAAAALTTLYPIQEETGISLTAESSPQATVSTSVASEMQLHPQQQLTHSRISMTSSPATALQGEDSSSSSTSGSQISNSSGGDTLSSDSFSGAVSELMQHIDSTLASLAGVSSSAASDIPQPSRTAAEATTAGAGTAGSSSSLLRQQALGQYPHRLGSSSSSRATNNGSSSTPTMNTAGVLSAAATSSGNDTSRSSSRATDSSAARLLEEVLAAADLGLASPASSASSAGGDTGTSRLLHTPAGPEAATSAPAYIASAAVEHAPALQTPAAAALPTMVTADVSDEGSHRVFTGPSSSAQAAAAGGMSATTAAAATTTAETPGSMTVTSSADTEELLGSLGSLLAASTPSSSNDSNGGGSGSEFSFQAALRSSSLTAGAQLDDSRSALNESASDFAGTSSNSSQQPRAAVQASLQRQQQQPVASSGLSELLADILADDPELAAQMSSQSLG